jgi:hypothetical protein
MKAVNLEKLLPADIPAGERILWHGRPEWKSLARGAFRVDFVAGYFGLMTLWNVASAAADSGWQAAGLAAAKTFGSGFAALALLCLLSWLSARTTLYVVTSRRIVMKLGIALPVFFNLPFSQIASASLRVYSDGSGDITVTLGEGQRIAYLHLWPHARPFRITHPQPAMRSVPNANAVAETLRSALLAASNERRGVETPASAPSPVVTPDSAGSPANEAVAA